METQIVNGIHLPAWDTHFAGQINKSPIIDGKGTYQYRKIVAALEVAKRRGHAVDVGAHVGLWSRVLAMEFDAVSAFEPMPEFAMCFQRNLADWPNVRLYNFALGSCEETSPIGRIASDIASARIGAPGDEVIDVMVKPLDRLGLNPVDFLKIDVEGFDLEVIKGAEETIRRDRPVIVIEQKGRTEQYGGGKFSSVDILKSWGARLVAELWGDCVLAWR